MTDMQKDIEGTSTHEGSLRCRRCQRLPETAERKMGLLEVFALANGGRIGARYFKTLITTITVVAATPYSDGLTTLGSA